MGNHHTSAQYIKGIKGDEDNSRRPNLIFGAFLVYAVANILFVTYAGVDHYLERSALQGKIEKAKNELERIKRSLPSQPTCQGKNLCQNISKIIEQKRKCDRTYASINLMKAMMAENQEGDLVMWANIPKAFIHLHGENLSVEKGKGTVNKMDVVKGWQWDGGECTGQEDPVFQNNVITVSVDGNYSVYSQITFKCPDEINDGQLGTVHHHVVQFTETYANFVDDPKVLLESTYLMCGHGDEGKIKVSRQGGIYEMTEGDMLQVLVKKDQNTVLYHDDEAKNDAEFAIVLI